MATSNKVYKVTYENQDTLEVFSVFLEAESSAVAGLKVMATLDQRFDLLSSRNAKKEELQ